MKDNKNIGRLYNQDFEIIIDIFHHICTIPYTMYEPMREREREKERDNQPAIDTVKHNKICKGNKHIANRYYFVKDNYKQKQIDINHIATKENIADIMTKPLTKTQFEYLRDKFMHAIIDT